MPPSGLTHTKSCVSQKTHIFWDILTQPIKIIKGAYDDPQTGIGLILGTGSNAAYLEDAEKIFHLCTGQKSFLFILDMLAQNSIRFFFNKYHPFR